MLTKAYASTPHTYDANIPDALANICQTAMARDPEERFQTAAAFSTAVSRFLEFRNSNLLTDEASASLEALRDMVSLPGQDGDHHAHYRLFNECRFGFLNALRIWENNDKAREGLQAAVELMIEFELAHGSAGAAEALVSDLLEKRPRLASRIARKREREHSTMMELDELKRDLDPTGADRPRAVLSFVMAATWPAIHGALWWVDENTGYPVGHLELAAVYGFFALASIVVAIVARDKLLARARFGLQTQMVLTLLYGGSAFLWLVAHKLEIAVPSCFTLAFFFGIIAWVTAAITVDQRMMAWAIAMAAGLVASVLMPALGIVWMGAAGALGGIAMGILRIRSKSASDTLPLSARWSKHEAEAILATTRRSSNESG